MKSPREGPVRPSLQGPGGGGECPGGENKVCKKNEGLKPEASLILLRRKEKTRTPEK